MNRVLRQTPRVSPSTVPTCVSVLVGTWRGTMDASWKVRVLTTLLNSAKHHSYVTNLILVLHHTQMKLKNTLYDMNTITMFV